MDPLHHPEIFRPSSTSYTVLLIFAGLSLCLFGVLVEIGCLLSARRKGESGLEQRINLRMRTFKNMDEYIDIDV